MKRIMIQADERLLERARDRASQEGISIAQLFRRALERDLGQQAAPPPLRSIGLVASEHGDLSRRASQGEFEPEPFR